MTEDAFKIIFLTCAVCVMLVITLFGMYSVGRNNVAYDCRHTGVTIIGNTVFDCKER